MGLMGLIGLMRPMSSGRPLISPIGLISPVPLVLPKRRSPVAIAATGLPGLFFMRKRFAYFSTAFPFLMKMPFWGSLWSWRPLRS